MIPNPWAIFALVISHGGAYWYGQHVEAAEQAQAQLDQVLAYAGEIRARQAAVDGLAAELETARAAQRPKDRTITREVIRYVDTVPPDRRCELDGAWRLLHDAAATGEPPDPARVAAGDAPSVADATALDAVAENYADCRDVRAALIGWQRWWGKVRSETVASP